MYECKKNEKQEKYNRIKKKRCVQKERVKNKKIKIRKKALKNHQN